MQNQDWSVWSCLFSPLHWRPNCLIWSRKCLLNCVLLFDLLSIITKIVNLSFETSRMPNSLKWAALSPLLKKPSLDTEQFQNCRPVSNLKLLRAYGVIFVKTTWIRPCNLYICRMISSELSIIVQLPFGHRQLWNSVIKTSF